MAIILNLAMIILKIYQTFFISMDLYIKSLSRKYYVHVITNAMCGQTAVSTLLSTTVLYIIMIVSIYLHSHIRSSNWDILVTLFVYIMPCLRLPYQNRYNTYTPTPLGTVVAVTVSKTAALQSDEPGNGRSFHGLLRYCRSKPFRAWRSYDWRKAC